MPRSIHHFLTCLTILLVLSACAVKVTPQGGTKDTTPPKVVQSTPDTMSVNFTGHKITIAFDEFIALREPSQIIISPPLESEPEFTVKNRSLVISYSDTLAENTTYTINFGNAIVDVNESNILENYQFVFSTGPVLDTLFMAGKVLNATDLTPVSKVLVMLYTELEDSVPMKQRPLYYAKTDAAGNFKINHIADKTYKIFALNDKDADYLYNQPNEEVGFYETPLEASKRPRLDLRIFKSGKAPLRLMKSNYETPGKLTLVYTTGMESLSVEALRGSNKEKPYERLEKSVLGDTLTFYIKQSEKDTLEWIIKADTLQADTVKLVQKKQEMQKGKARQGFNLSSEITNTIGLEQKLLLTSNYPIQSFTDSSFQLTQDSVRIRPKIYLTDSTSRRLLIDFKAQEAAKYSLFIPPGCITDVYGQTTDTLRMAFTALRTKDYGTLKLHLNTAESGSFILQLVDEKDRVMDQRFPNGNQVLDYKLLLPGNYRFKLIFDTNYNKKFDNGDYLLHRQPEKVVYFGKTIAIKSNWDVEEDWKP